MLAFKTLAQTCIACPSQWEGQLEDGRFVYARFRYGTLSVRASNVSVSDAVMDGDILIRETFSDSLDGVLSTQEMLDKLGATYDPAQVARIDANTAEQHNQL